VNHVINVRGTGGSGKSTLVKKIMERYERRDPQFIPGRRRPVSTICAGEGSTLYVPGHYDTPCGGCDTLKTVDFTYQLVNDAADLGYSVLYEGIMVMDDVRRAVELSKRHQLTVIYLTTPIADCLRAIEERRAARGETEPLNPKNTEDRARRALSGLSRLRDAGVRVERLDRDGALMLVKELLNVA
jgi:hypothetical protein